jgi:myo-inositol-1(or 4)-monophosphatase
MPGAARYARERAVAEAAAREAGAFIRAHAGTLGAEAITQKGVHDLVTVVDREAEALVLRHLRAAFPADAVLAEESAAGADLGASDAGRRWIVDPLDGTTNFTHGVPPYAVSIALEEAGRLVVGVVYDVPHDELFAAVRGGGLTRNGAPAGVSDTARLDDALIATGFPFRDFRYLDGYVAAFRAVAQATRGIRRHGAASVDLAWVACGRFDGFFEAGLAPWDAAAGVLLVEEGGGRVEGLPAGAHPVFDGGLVVSNGRLHAALREAAAPLGAAWAARSGGM